MTALQIQNDEFIISVAKPGENVKVIVKVSATDEEFIGKGSVISHPLSPCVVTQDIVAQLVILQLLETKVRLLVYFDRVFLMWLENIYCGVPVRDPSWNCR